MQRSGRRIRIGVGLVVALGMALGSLAAEPGHLATVGAGALIGPVAAVPGAGTLFGGDGSGAVSIVDGVGLRSLGTVSGPGREIDVAADSLRGLVYVVSQGGSIQVRNAVTHGLVETIPIDGARASTNHVAINTTTRRLYVGRHQDGTTSLVQVLDAAGSNPHALLATIDTTLSGLGACQVAVNELTDTIFTTTGGDSRLASISGTTHALRTMSLPGVVAGSGFDGLGVDPETDRVFVPVFTGSQHRIAVVRGTALTLEALLPIGAYSLMTDPGSGRTFASSPVDSTIWVVDRFLRVSGRLSTPRSGFITTYLPEVERAFVIADGPGRSAVFAFDAPRACDGTLGSWAATEAFSPGRSSHRVLARDGVAHLIAGQSAGGNLSDVQSARILAGGGLGSWNASPSLPRAREGFAAEIQAGSMFVIGGIMDGVSTNEVLFAPVDADGNVGTWSVTQPLPSPRQNLASASSGGFVYALGGRQDSGGNFSEVWFARVQPNGSLGSWTSTTPLTVGKRGHAAVAWGGRLYVAGGYREISSREVFATVESAPILSDGHLGAWTTHASLPTPVTGLALVATQGFLFAVGGDDHQGTIYDTVLSAPLGVDGSPGSWAARTRLPSPRSGVAAFAAGDSLYVAGGVQPDGGRLGEVLIAHLDCVPAAPGLLSVTSNEDARGELLLHWTDRSGDESGFEIERRSGESAFESVATTGPDVTEYTDDALADGATYSYRVRAMNSVGNSAWSIVASAATPAAPPGPVLLVAAADTYLRAGHPNQNQNDEQFLRVRANGNNRALVRFDQEEIEMALRSRPLASARLRLFVSDNHDNWGSSGRPVAVHRVLEAWTESGATWNSPDDQDTSNSRVDGPSWEMGGNDSSEWPYSETATAEVLHSNGLSGWVEWDVTADVEGFLSGGAENLGWIVRKVDEGQPGWVEYHAR